MIHPLKVSFEDLYNGTTKRLSPFPQRDVLKVQRLSSLQLNLWLLFFVASFLPIAEMGQNQGNQ